MHNNLLEQEDFLKAVEVWKLKKTMVFQDQANTTNHKTFYLIKPPLGKQ